MTPKNYLFHNKLIKWLETKNIDERYLKQLQKLIKQLATKNIDEMYLK